MRCSSQSPPASRKVLTPLSALIPAPVSTNTRSPGPTRSGGNPVPGATLGSGTMAAKRRVARGALAGKDLPHGRRPAAPRALAPDLRPLPGRAHRGGPPRLPRLFAGAPALERSFVPRVCRLAPPEARGAVRRGLPGRGRRPLSPVADRDAPLARVRAGGAAAARGSAADACAHGPRRLPRAARRRVPGALPGVLRAELPLP